MATQTQYYNLDKPSYDEVADIEIINANFDKIDQQMRNNADGVNFAKGISSDAYDNSKLYAVGDYCIYDNKLYRCITAIESAEAFNIAKWEQTTVGKEINQLNSNLVGLKVGENFGGKNLFDENEIFSSIGTKKDGYWYVYSVILHDKYNNGFPISIDVNSQYTMSFDAIGSADKATTNFYVKYTDGTKDGIIVYGDSERHYKLTTKAGKIISDIIATYSYGGTDKFKNFQIEKGSQETDYEPYIPSVKMLAEEVNQQKNDLDNLAYGENGVHNLLNTTLQTTTKNGITCTNNGDGTYTFNGTVDSGAYPEFNLGMITLDKGEYLFTNQDSTIYLWCGTSEGNFDIINRPLIGGTFINIKNKSDIYISLVCSSGETYHNVVIKPMITEDLTATYDDFVPYIPSVKMLAEEVNAQKNDLCKRVDYSTVDIFTAIKQYDETATQEIPIQFVVQTQTIVYLVNGFKHGSYSSYLAYSYGSGDIYHVRSYNGVWSYNQLAYMS